MSNYTKSTNFATKDNLTPGDPLKVVRGTEIDTEYNNIATAIATKTDNASAAITGGSITGITDLAVADGGTGASTAAGALNNLLPSQTGNANKYLQTDGTNATWDAVSLSTADITGTLPVANGGTGVTSSTGTGSVVLSNSPTLVTPALGTPASGVATNLTGLPISTGVSGLGTGVATFLGTPSSANLISAVTDETGTGSLVFATSPTLVTPALGTPSALVGTNITGTASGLTAGNVTTNANLTGAVTSVGNATSLGSFTSSQLAGALTDETGSGANVFATSPTLVTPILGTPTSATLTNATGLPLTTGVTGTLPTANGGTNLGGATPFTSGGVVYASSTSALATGSALNFNGTSLSVSGGRVNALTADVGGTIGGTSQFVSVNTDFTVGNFSGIRFNYLNSGDSGGKFAYIGAVLTSDATNGLADMVFGVKSSTATNTISEQMRLTSTGLGIGTSSPLGRLDVAFSGAGYSRVRSTSATTAGTLFQNSATGTGDNNGLFVGVDGTSTGYFYNYANAALVFGNNATEKMRLDSAGNLGLGTAPSAWGTSGAVFKAIEYGAVGNAVAGLSTGPELEMLSNAYYNGGWKYANTGVTALRASLNGDVAGAFTWNTAPSGTAGNPISFTQAMTLDASGNLMVGGTSNPSEARLYLESASTAGTLLNIRNTSTGGYSWNIASVGSAAVLAPVGSLAFRDSTNGATRMVIDSSGNVGIGTSSPSQKLSVKGGNGNQADFDNAGERYTQVNWSNSGALKGAIWADNTNSLFEMYGHTGIGLSFYTNTTERARIDSSGNLLIGTTSAYGTGTTIIPAGLVFVSRNADVSGVFDRSGSSNGDAVQFRYNGNTVGSVSVTSSATAYNTSSDYRLKDNQQPLTGSGSFIDALQPKTWSWKADGSKGVGFIAHEAQTVSPSSVTGNKDAVDEDGKPIMQAMEYGSAEFIANIIAELQSLRQRLAVLEAK